MTTTTTLEVSGMSCSSCVEHVEEALRIDGVQGARVDVAAGRVTITHDPAVPPGRLVAALEQAGYGAKPRKCCGCC